MKTFMDDVEITVRLPRAMAQAVLRYADGRNRAGSADVQAVAEDMTDLLAGTTIAPSASQSDSVRRILERAFAYSFSWQELQGRLMCEGYALRLSREGLDLLSHPGAERVSTVEAFGLSYRAMLRKFGKAFPAPFASPMAKPTRSITHPTDEPAVSCEETNIRVFPAVDPGSPLGSCGSLRPAQRRKPDEDTAPIIL